MPFTYNGNTPLAINYNGNPVSILIYNGVEVWTSEPDYLQFWSTESTHSYGLSAVGYTDDLPEIYYRIDDGEWTEYTFGTSIEVGANHTIYWKGDNETLSYSPEKYIQFTDSSSTATSISGNIMSLIDSTCRSKIISADYCFAKLFSGFKSEINLVFYKFKLPAITLSEGCYYELFKGNIIVSEEMPKLPALSVPDYAYYHMFDSCSTTPLSTLEMPNLPAINVGDYAYAGMFTNQSYGTVIYPSVLPATTLGEHAYDGMFKNSGISSAPELPVTELVSGCYNEMFYGCSNINYIKVPFTDWSTGCTDNWLYGVSSTGTFECSSVLGTNDTIERGTSYCPTEWTVENGDYLCLTCITPGRLLLYCANYYGGEPYHIEAKLNCGDWDEYEIDSTDFNQTYDMVEGDKLYVRGYNDTFNSNNHGRFRFGAYSTSDVPLQVDLSGDITSLLNGVGGVDDLTQYGDRVFSNLFDNANSARGDLLYIIHSKDLVLPSTTLSEVCYSNLFRRQTDMVDTPELISTTLAEQCYNYLCYECYSVQEAKIYYTGYFADAPANAFRQWLKGVPDTGTLYYNGEDRTTGAAAIPQGWTVESF